MQNISYYTTIDREMPKKNNYKVFTIMELEDDGMTPKEVAWRKLSRTELFDVLDHLGNTDVKLPLIESNGQNSASVTFKSSLGKSYMLFGAIDKESYEKDRDEYNKECCEKLDNFYRDLAEEYGVNPHSEFHSIVYGKAYQDGHSGGLSEVESTYGELLEFAEKIENLYRS